jgi:hypothetical protein
MRGPDAGSACIEPSEVGYSSLKSAGSQGSVKTVARRMEALWLSRVVTIASLFIVSLFVLAGPANASPRDEFIQLMLQPQEPVIGGDPATLLSGAPPKSESGAVGLKDGRTCIRRASRVICSTYQNGKLVKRCVRQGRLRTCTYFRLNGKPKRRCVDRSGRLLRCVFFNRAGKPTRRCTYHPLRCTSVRGRPVASVGERKELHPTDFARLSWQGFPSTVSVPVGKIQMTSPSGRSGSCSGTVVSRSLVLTAGHCLYSHKAGDTGYMSAVYFAPGSTWDNYADPSSITTPWGVWKAAPGYGGNYWVPNEYIQGDPAFDYGLIEFAPAPNYIGDVTGSWNITTGIQWGYGARAYLMGYPASGHWATANGGYGRGQYACDSLYDAQYSAIGNGYELWFTCTMNGGASGGPVFVLLDNGTWTIGGVNDRCWGPNMNDPKNYCTPYSDYLRSSYFDSRFLTFWQTVQNQLTY